MILSRNLLWKVGCAIALFMLTCLVGNCFLSKQRSITRAMLGHDFLVFYSGGQLVQEGRWDLLYDMPTLKEMEHETGAQFDLEMSKGFGPWWNPPHAALIFSPFAEMDYPQALLAWQAVSALMFALSATLLIKLLPRGVNWHTWALVPLLMIVSMPFVQAVSHGQNTFLTLLLLTVTVYFWRRSALQPEFAFIAGFVCGLLAYKPQHAALIGLVLVLTTGRRALLGLLLSITATLVLTQYAMPGALGDFLLRMPANLQHFQDDQRYMWERHVTFKAFWRLLIQGWSTGETQSLVKAMWFICWTILAAMLGRAIWQSRGGHCFDRVICATIVCTPLLMPFYFDYDLLLLSVAAVLYAADRLTEPAHWTDRYLSLAWAAFFGCLEMGTVMAGHLRFNPTVPIASCLATLLVLRATSAKSVVVHQEDALPDGVPLAA